MVAFSFTEVLIPNVMVLHFRPSGCEETVADDLGPQLHSKKECESNDRLIHFAECSNVRLQHCSAQLNFFVEQQKALTESVRNFTVSASVWE